MSDRNELLDKAIADAKEAEDWQLVEWLRTARGSESAAQWYSDKLRKALRAERKLLNENAKLKELAKLMHETIRDLQETLDASVVVGGVELSAEYFETELNKLGIEVEE